jgi:orotate phosphoribosyltransferase-like protein
MLSLLANGMSARGIAGKLNISERTVEWHIARAMKKLAARNRIQAVVVAIRDGLIPLDGAVKATRIDNAGSTERHLRLSGQPPGAK